MRNWQSAYIGLGSNMGNARDNVLAALRALEGLPETRVYARSRLYLSKPLGPVAQADFVNAAAGLLTQLAAAQLLAALAALEAAQGRPAVRQRWGPRVLDLDLLVYGRERRAEPQLTLPHPGIVERNFVLYPLADIAPDLDVPGLGRVTQLLRGVDAAGLSALPSMH